VTHHNYAWQESSRSDTITIVVNRYLGNSALFAESMGILQTNFVAWKPYGPQPAGRNVGNA
jgi:hypothetical protein